jgi:site-specific recombinase XerD
MGRGRTPKVTDAIAAFLRSREATGATAATLRTYTAELFRFARAAGVETLTDLTVEIVERILADRRAQVRPISAHRTYRTLRTFCRWCVRTGRLSADPMIGLVMKLPKTLPRVPCDSDVRALLHACAPTTPEGRRNRVIIALLADSGLRKEELRLLRVGDVDLTTCMIRVVAGKGQRDGVGFFGEGASSLLRAWLAVHPDPRPQAFLLVTREGIPLGPWAIVRILYRLSRRAGLARKLGPHALRHYAATSLLKRTGDLELVRRVLRHTTLAMALRYATLTQTEVAAKFQQAAPLDHLWALNALGARAGTGRGFRQAKG